MTPNSIDNDLGDLDELKKQTKICNKLGFKIVGPVYKSWTISTTPSTGPDITESGFSARSGAIVINLLSCGNPSNISIQFPLCNSFDVDLPETAS